MTAVLEDRSWGEACIVATFTLYYFAVASWGVYAACSFYKINRGLKAFDEKKQADEILFCRTDTHTWSFAQSVIGALTILPVRLTLTILFFCFGLFLSMILVIWENHNYLDNETLCRLGRNRRPIVLYNKILGSFTFACLFCMGIRVNEMSFDRNGNLTDSRVPRHMLNTVISNHVAALDILYLLGTIQPGFVAKAGVKKMPIVGSIATVLGTVFVNRSAAQSREATLEAIVDRQRLLSIQTDRNKKENKENSNLRPIVIFPEGTTTSGIGILPFKRGAFFNEKAVVNPVLLTYNAPKYNSNIWIPSYDIIDMIIYIPLLLSNLGNVRLSAYWYDNRGLCRQPDETCEAFTARCEQFMRSNLDYLRACGKMLGGEQEGKRWTPSLPISLSNHSFIETKALLRARILGKKDKFYHEATKGEGDNEKDGLLEQKRTSAPKSR